ncbi:MAG: S-layer homology domain-containing protein, partial [Clostridiales bacterium]|nr:S-layer homology domain-containing protein [Clostridiales bacterium]
NVESAGIGMGFIYAVKTDGTLWLSGDMHDLVEYQGSTRAATKVIDNVSWFGQNALSDFCYVALRTDGTLSGWDPVSYSLTDDGIIVLNDHPKRLMDSVSQVRLGNKLTTALKKDGSVWSWTSQIISDTVDLAISPVKMLDSAKSIYVNNGLSGAIKTDGSFWIWGRFNPPSGYAFDLSSGASKVMDGVASALITPSGILLIKADGSLYFSDYNFSTDSASAYVKVMDGAKIPGPKPTSAAQPTVAPGLSQATVSPQPLPSVAPLPSGGPQSTSAPLPSGGPQSTSALLPSGSPKPTGAGPLPSITPTPRYSYGAPDPSASLVLPTELLPAVTTPESAAEAVRKAASALTAEQKMSPECIDLLTLYAQEAATRATVVIAEGDLVIDKTTLLALQALGKAASDAVEEAMIASGVIPRRSLGVAVTLQTANTGVFGITVYPSASQVAVDSVKVLAPSIAVTISQEMIKSLESPVKITVNPPASDQAYQVIFDKFVDSNVKISIPPASGSFEYQAIVNKSGDAVGGKYNPANRMLEARISSSGDFKSQENKKSFKDILDLASEMQTAINVLASKGVISGTSAVTFSPDAPINRAEIAALVTKTLSKLNPGQDGSFSDVLQSDWYFGAAGSAKKHGIMAGTSESTFSPKTVIPKDQIVAVSARVLRLEMRYKDPADDSSLAKFLDYKSFSDWSRADLSLAARENLFVLREDGLFSPSDSMTRGDAAVVLYRLFMKIW